jgi:hypothetical protein
VIVVGIAPGVRNLAYCVLHYRDGELPRVPGFGADLLKGIRLNGATSFLDLQRKASVHVKILSVVLERFPPVVLAVGPQAVPRESELQVEAARLVLKLLVAGLADRGMRIEVMDWDSKEELLEELGASRWSSVLGGRIAQPDEARAREKLERRLRKPAVRIAAAAALAAGSRRKLENSQVKTTLHVKRRPSGREG